jgi:hypothetical protein
MQDYNNALVYALNSGPLFNLNENSYYVRAMISIWFDSDHNPIDTCIEEYKEYRKAKLDDSELPAGVCQIINFIFSQSLNSNNFSQLLGISVECNRMDLLEEALRRSTDISSSLFSLLKLVNDFNYPSEIRLTLLQLAQRLFQENGNLYGIFKCLLYLHNDTDSTWAYSYLLLVTDLLLHTTESDKELALQMAFDLFNLQDMHRTRCILERFPKEPSAEQQVLKDVLNGKITDAMYCW